MVTDAFGRVRAAGEAELGESQTRATDVMAIAEHAWTAALESCAMRLHLDSAQAAADRMLSGEDVVRLHCCQGLADQLATSLWASQDGLQAVYAPDCDRCPQDFCLDNGGGLNAPCVHLLVWAEHRTPALAARGAALGNALARVCQDFGGLRDLPTVLHMRVMDDSDLIKLFGSGQQERWAARLEAYWLSMNEVVQTLYPRNGAT